VTEGRIGYIATNIPIWKKLFRLDGEVLLEVHDLQLTVVPECVKPRNGKSYSFNKLDNITIIMDQFVLLLSLKIIKRKKYKEINFYFILSYHIISYLHICLYIIHIKYCS
jgi:hypothetical protein